MKLHRATLYRLDGRLIALSILSIGGVGCGLSGDRDVTRLRESELSPALTQTTTTTTTTTTTAPQPTEPPVSVATDETTTSVAPVPLVEVKLFYVIRGSESLQLLPRNLPEGVPTKQVQAELERPSIDLAEFNLQTAVRVGLIEDLVVERSTASVAFNRIVFDQMDEAQQRNAIAQIVLTLTSFVTPADGAIGQVLFMLDGEPIPVFLPSIGANSEVGAPVFYEDFKSTVSETPVATTTTSTPTTVAPIVPESTQP